jgi:hypothetical protein
MWKGRHRLYHGMNRRLLNLLTAMSLLLCLAVVVLWVRSYWVLDEWYRDRRVRTAAGGKAAVVSVVSGGAELTCRVGRMDHPWVFGPKTGAEWWPPPGQTLSSAQWRRDPWRGRATWPMSFRFDAFPQDQPVVWTVVAPHWAPAAALALLPLVRTVPLLRRRTRRAGLCLQCGYDLRATPDRCPECGRTSALDSA